MSAVAWRGNPPDEAADASTKPTESGLRPHPVIGLEVPARELQELTVGWVIHRFNAHDARRDCGRMRLQMFEELELGGGWADDQDFAGILDRVGDFLIVLMIRRRLARSDNTVFVMQMGFVLGLRMDDTCFCIVWVEVDDMRFLVIDPDDTVIVAHRVLQPCGVGAKYTAAA